MTLSAAKTHDAATGMRHLLRLAPAAGALKFKTKYPSTLNLTNAQARLCLLVWQVRGQPVVRWRR